MLVETYFARQPILDRRLRVRAYEVLYRSGSLADQAAVIGGPAATASVLAGAFSHVELPDLLAGLPGFVNLPRELVVERALLSFPPERVGAEILEDVQPDPEVLSALRELRGLGYKVALDGFSLRDGRSTMLAHADIAKVDIQALEPAELSRTAGLLRSVGITMLAENVETEVEFARCARLGFELFQGFFFARPELVPGRQLDEGRRGLLSLLSQLHDPRLSIAEVARAVEQHPDLTLQMLRVLNSAALGLTRPVESIREAAIMLGLRRITELASVLVLASHDHKPHELISMGLSRARMCELIAERTGADDPASFFTVGVFSVLDALTDSPMCEVVSTLPLATDVVEALINRVGPKGTVLQAAIAYERAAWEHLPEFGVDARTLSLAYLEALDWAGAMLRSIRA